MDTKSLATGEAALIFPVTARALMSLHPLVFGFQSSAGVGPIDETGAANTARTVGPAYLFSHV